MIILYTEETAMNPCMIYITTKDEAEAKKIGRALLVEKLVACVNIIDGMKSMYWWKDNIQVENETILIAKSKEGLMNRIIEKVKSEHSYDCPCIVSIPLGKGNPDFYEWIQEVTE